MQTGMKAKTAARGDAVTGTELNYCPGAVGSITYLLRAGGHESTDGGLIRCTVHRATFGMHFTLTLKALLGLQLNHSINKVSNK